MKKKENNPKVCPLCKGKLKRKGKKGSLDQYYKCIVCSGIIRNGSFNQHKPKEMKEFDNITLKQQRKEEQVKKLIKNLKKEKYIDSNWFEFNGLIYNLDDYDKNGIKIKKDENNEYTL